MRREVSGSAASRLTVRTIVTKPGHHFWRMSMRSVKELLNRVFRRKRIKPPGFADGTEPKPPFRVDIVDLFQGHDEYGYDPHGEYDSLEEAIAAARELTEEGIRESTSKEEWRHFGIAGLVYDSRHMLVWDGVREYEA